MNAPLDENLDQYYTQASSWSADRANANASSRKAAWIVAAIAALIALTEAIALIILLPLKTIVPYTLMVDRQTGNVQSLKPLERQDISPDDALVRSFLVQYVIARESFDIGTVQADYRKVALWSTGDARDRYITAMQASNPTSPLAGSSRQTSVSTEVSSISSLNARTALVRFMTTKADPRAQGSSAQHWVAVIRYQFSNAGMSEADRFLNPLGFQVVRYRRNAESMPRLVVPVRGDVPVTSEVASR